MSHVAQNFEIETASGLYLDLSAPSPSAIRLEDIAHALARTCRFGGHCERFYSVAEHAVKVSAKVVAAGHRDLGLAALHHDDAEAYLGDIPRPLKPLLGAAYSALTDDVDGAIAEALGDLWSPNDLERAIVKAADLWMLAVEADQLLPSRGKGWNLDPYWAVPRFGHRLGLTPEHAAAAFLEQHHWLVRCADARASTQDDAQPKDAA